MHGGDLVVRALEEIGTSVIFGLPGGQTSPLYDAIGRSNKIRHVLVRDERTGAYAADAYARVTGRIGVCDATVGPGATKLPSGLYEALNASIPILALVSGQEIERFNYFDKGRASQGIDQVNLLRPVSKKVITVTSADRIIETIRIASITACSGRPGPVVVELPANVLSEVVPDYSEAEVSCVDAVFPLYPSTAPSETIEEAANLLAQSERPLIVAGGGVLISGAAGALTSLVTDMSIPVVTTYTGKGSVPDTHPMCLGFTGTTGIPVNEQLCRSADVVVLIGMKSSQNTTFNWTFPEKTQRVIHIDIDPEDMNRFFKTDVCLVGDARLIVESLHGLMKKQVQTSRPNWLQRVESAKQEWRQLKTEEQSTSQIPITPQRVMKAIQSFIDGSTCIVADASFASGWVAEFLEQTLPGRYSLYPRGSAGLGWGLPAAIGVSASGKFKKVIVVAGDGGFGYSVGELATLQRQGYPVVSVVLNNSTLGWIKWVTNMAFKTEPPSTNFNDTDFAAVAKGFGLHGVTVSDPDELESALSNLISTGEGGVLNVKTAWDQAPVWSYRTALSMKLDGDEVELRGYVRT